jgi:hypothetical protein
MEAFLKHHIITLCLFIQRQCQTFYPCTLSTKFKLFIIGLFYRKVQKFPVQKLTKFFFILVQLWKNFGKFLGKSYNATRED